MSSTRIRPDFAVESPSRTDRLETAMNAPRQMLCLVCVAERERGEPVKSFSFPLSFFCDLPYFFFPFTENPIGGERWMF